MHYKMRWWERERRWGALMHTRGYRQRDKRFCWNGQASKKGLMMIHVAKRDKWGISYPCLCFFYSFSSSSYSVHDFHAASMMCVMDYSVNIWWHETRCITGRQEKREREGKKWCVKWQGWRWIYLCESIDRLDVISCSRSDTDDSRGDDVAIVAAAVAVAVSRVDCWFESQGESCNSLR